jgi:hypothetical protein
MQEQHNKDRQFSYVMPCDRTRYADLFSDTLSRFEVPDGIVDGFVGGMVVDSLEKPSVGRMWFHMNHYFGGDPSHPRASHVVPELPGSYLMVCPQNSSWPRFLYEHLHGRYGDKVKKCHYFQFRMTNPDIGHLRNLANTELPDGFRLTWIDRDAAMLMERQKLPGDDYCCLPIQFTSAEDFLARSYGYCVRNEEKVCSIATLWFPSSRYAEIQIETRLEVQRRGFAATAAAAFCLYSIERGLTPVWICTSTLSAKTAARIGFEMTDAFECLFLSEGVLDPAMNVEHHIPLAMRRFDFGKRETYPYLHEPSVADA